jgi:prolyl 4-hydroxylase
MIIELNDFLNTQDCDALIKLIKANNQPSTVADATKKAVVDSSRTSTTCNLPADNDVVLRLSKKIANTLGIRTAKIEALQGQLYKVGQEFKPHYDFFLGEHYNQHCLSSGNRTQTLMIYLNDGLEGGETEFSILKQSFKPTKGKALLWNNMIDGKVNNDVLHAGKPIIKGKKYIITAWIRENDWNGAEDNRLAQEHMVKKSHTFSSALDFPKLTKNGFEVFKFDDKLFNDCVEGIISVADKSYKEEYAGKDNTQPGSSTIYPIWEIPNLTNKIHDYLLPKLEAWCGEELEKTFIYGFRNYHKNSSLILHTDRIETHQISAIIMMSKDLRCGCGYKEFGDDWALQIKGHDGETNEIFFEPQDMVFYESAVCEHGRIKPFEGKDYVNFYVHYKLKNYSYIND